MHANNVSRACINRSYNIHNNIIIMQLGTMDNNNNNKIVPAKGVRRRKKSLTPNSQDEDCYT